MRLRRTVRPAKWPPLALAAIACAIATGGCESTQEKSAQLEREAKRVTLAQKGLSIARESSVVTVLGATVAHDSEGAAVAVTLRNDSGKTLRAVPLAITVTGAGGQMLFENNAAGLEAALTSVPSLPAHGTVTWVDDQVPPNGEPAKASAKVGEAPAVSGSPPPISVTGVHPINDPTNGPGAAGRVSNRSGVAQRNLAVFVVGRRGGRIAAAGRAVLPALGAHASLPFQVFLIGDSHGATLEASAPAATF